MTTTSSYRKYRKIFSFLPLILLFPTLSFAQRSRPDSLQKLLLTEKKDTSRVKLLWQLARDLGVNNPDTALTVAHQALKLAQEIGYEEGESRSLGVMANTFIKIGNYPRALELNIRKLQLEEKRNNPRNLGSVLMNIGVVYILQEEYRKAMEYLVKADSVIRKHNIEDLRYYSALNIGEVYSKLDISDSAYIYFSRSLDIAKEIDDGDFVGTSMTGLGHTYLKLKRYELALLSYTTGIAFLKAANDDEILCEATLGLAKLYEELRDHDSARYYASYSLFIAKKDGFLSRELEAAEFLTDHYKRTKNMDSAFTYVSYVKGLNDSMNSKSKIRESQVISSNEQFRQLEIAEEKRVAKAERIQQLQMLLIAIFIPGLFLITLLLTRVKLHARFIRLLGVLSLLFLFEYLTLLLHPSVARLTHHTPVYEILIFVGLAAILIPLHHRLEHWLIQKLIHHRHLHEQRRKKTRAPAPVTE
jgi:tetratricopeptide (TPR) repeat protein